VPVPLLVSAGCLCRTLGQEVIGVRLLNFRRRRVTRCEARKVEQPFSLQCELRAGHPGAHYAGHQHWDRDDSLVERTAMFWPRRTKSGAYGHR
jgi:hypothetical protein